MNNDVQNLLRIIKFSPILIILLVIIFSVIFIYHEQKIELEKEKQLIEKQYLIDEKERVKLNVQTINNYIQDEKNQAQKQLKTTLQEEMNKAYNIVLHIYNKNKTTKTKEQIIELIKNTLEKYRFNSGRGYFSIHTMNGMNILHPVNKKFEGTSVLNRRDAIGNYPVQNAIKIVKEKDVGFMYWYYNRPDDRSKERKKIGIVKRFKPYDLIFTTAEYFEDFENSLKTRVLSRIKSLKKGDEQYVAILDYQGTFLYHPSSKIQNKNIFENKKFSHVTTFYGNLIKNNSIKDGFHTIKLTVQDTKVKDEIKTIYSLKFNDWQWILSSGFNMSGVNSIIEKRKDILEEKYSTYKKEVIVYGFILAFILLITSYIISKLLEKRFLNYKKRLEKEVQKNIKQKEILLKAQKVAHIGDWKLNLLTKKAFWSNEILRIFGLEQINNQEFGPEYLKTIMMEEDISCFQESLDKCIAQDIEHQCTYRIKRPNGETRWIDCRGKLTDDKSSIIGTVQDITENKLLEIEKHQKTELLYQQSKMAAMGEMLSNIAHQWRQPLSTISTASTGVKLQKEVGVLTDEQLYSALTSINDSAQYLSQTIEDFRGFFNPNNTEEEFNISNTLDRTLKLVSSQFISKDIKIIQNIDSYTLYSFENEIMQVLINVLNNAKDILMTKKNQEKLIFINAYKENDISCIEIIDNAGGVKETIINRIFEPYFTTKHQSQGTGIGLYMSLDIIKNHLNGSIDVSNETYVYEGIEYTGAKFLIKI